MLALFYNFPSLPGCDITRCRFPCLKPLRNRGKLRESGCSGQMISLERPLPRRADA